MLTHETIERLQAMRLRGMAEALREQQQDANLHRLSFEERLGLLVDRMRQRNPSVQGAELVMDWKGGRTSAGSRSAAAPEPGGGGAVGGRV